MSCFKHQWSEWGPPYEGSSGLRGTRNTFQQRECKRCHVRQKHRIGPAGHATAAVPIDNADRLLSAPGTASPEVECSSSARPRRRLS